MKEIKIHRLILENFKCHTFLELAPQGRSVTLYGDNAVGKTSIYDAFVWLLFGRDSLGNGEKNMEIQPLDGNGEIRDHKAITAVEALLLVDGTEITLRRTCREVWATRRGAGVPVYEGHTSDYFVNGVPVKKNAFDTAIRELVSEELFRMLTSVSHFAAGMKWQERRRILCGMTQTLSDRELLEKEPRFQPLLQELGSLSPGDFRTKLLHQRKGLLGVRDDTPARINECQRVLQDLEDTDLQAARQEEQELLRTRQSLQTRLLELEQNTALEKKRLQLREATLERQALQDRNDLFRQQHAPSPEAETALRAEAAGLLRDRQELARVEARLQQGEEQLRSCREEILLTERQTFGGGLCPTCGQALPFEQLQSAHRTFQQKQEQQLRQLQARYRTLQEDGAREEALAETLRSRIARTETAVSERQEALKTAAARDPGDMEGYPEAFRELTCRVDALEAELRKLTEDADGVAQSLREELAAGEDQLRQLRSRMAKQDLREQTLQRIHQLREADAKAALSLLHIDRMLFLLEEFARFKAGAMERSINSQFRIATFRLFREQANGGLEERCDPQFDGVPYPILNNAMKVNVGIDIINTLSRHYGVRVPLFIDNAESVTRLESCHSQVIRLVVSPQDPRLRMAD